MIRRPLSVIDFTPEEEERIRNCVIEMANKRIQNDDTSAKSKVSVEKRLFDESNVAAGEGGKSESLINDKDTPMELE